MSRPEIRHPWRHWFTDESIVRAVEGLGRRPPAPSYEGGVPEHARRIMGLVLADNPVERRAE